MQVALSMVRKKEEADFPWMFFELCSLFVVGMAGQHDSRGLAGARNIQPSLWALLLDLALKNVRLCPEMSYCISYLIIFDHICTSL